MPFAPQAWEDLWENAKARFKAKYEINEFTGCWNWTAGLRVDRGSFIMPRERGGSPAQRCAWRLFVGEIPQGIFVLHRCGNSMCVNPAHLYLGTHKDNMEDKREQTNSFKLTRTAVETIRQSKKHPNELALEYGVRKRTIYRVLSRERWLLPTRKDVLLWTT